MRIKAFRLATVDKEYYMHMQAWLNHQVTATKKQGDKQIPAFKRFKDFYDYEKQIKAIEEPKEQKITENERKTAKRLAAINSL